VVDLLNHRYAVGALICLAAIGATLSKGAMMGAFVALIIIGLLLRRAGRRAATLLLGLAAIGTVGVIAVGLIFGIERLNPFGDTAGARIELWRSALLMIRDHPLIGPGLDQFYHLRTAPEYGNRYIAPEALETTEQFAAHPHNLVLDLLVRVGPLGLLAMAWLLWQFFGLSRRVWNQQGPVSRDGALAMGLTAAMGAALTHGLVDNFYFVPDLAFAFWLMLALIETDGHAQTPARISGMRNHASLVADRRSPTGAVTHE